MCVSFRAERPSSAVKEPRSQGFCRLGRSPSRLTVLPASCDSGLSSPALGNLPSEDKACLEQVFLLGALAGSAALGSSYL